MQVFTDKEILNDGLCSQKATTGKLNMAANECVHEDLRKQILNVLGEEHSIQYEVFNMMHQRGLYQTPAALQYFGHLMRRVDSLEETLMLFGIGGRRKRGWQRMRWLDGTPTQWT